MALHVKVEASWNYLGKGLKSEQKLEISNKEEKC